MQGETSTYPNKNDGFLHVILVHITKQRVQFFPFIRGFYLVETYNNILVNAW